MLNKKKLTQNINALFFSMPTVLKMKWKLKNINTSKNNHCMALKKTGKPIYLLG